MSESDDDMFDSAAELEHRVFTGLPPTPPSSLRISLPLEGPEGFGGGQRVIDSPVFGLHLLPRPPRHAWHFFYRSRWLCTMIPQWLLFAHTQLFNVDVCILQ